MLTIETTLQASTLIGAVAGDIEHDDPLKPDIDLSLLDDRRVTSCGIMPDGRRWLGIGHHPGPGIAPAIVVFLPCRVHVVTHPKARPLPHPRGGLSGCRETGRIETPC